jgi:A118 family predicted phage portal protein
MKKEKDYFTIIETHKRIGNDSEIVTEVYKSRGKMDKGSPVMDISSVLPGIDKRVVIKNVKKTFAYFKPRITNNIDLTVPHGISIFANSLDLIQIYDLMLDTLYTEFDSGRKKILIPE